MRDKYYIGFSENKRRWEAFASNNDEDATPEASGYSKVVGGFDSYKTADIEAESRNDNETFN